MSGLQQEMEAFFAEYTQRWNDQDDYRILRLENEYLRGSLHAPGSL
jgi:hypothetical protein